MKGLKKLAGLSLASLLTIAPGCASNPARGTTPRFGLTIDGRVQTEPDFYRRPPSSPDSTYAVGTGTSRNKALAIRKAKLYAMVGLAQSKQSDVSQGYNSTSIRTSQTLFGVNTLEQEIVEKGSQYTVYVLMGMPNSGNTNR